MSKESSDTLAALIENKFLHIFGREFVEAVKFAMEMCKYNFLPKFEQLQAIYYLSRGKDVFVHLRTGFGKSLIYTLFPYVCDALRSSPNNDCRSSIVVLISPLISLMDDQMAKMAERGIHSVKLTDLKDRQVEDLRRGKSNIKIALLSPEAFTSLTVRETLRELKEHIVCVAIDEAHCVLQWGRDFRSAYNELKDIRALMMAGLPITALTATANCKTMNYITAKLDMEGCIVIKSSTNRPNIFYKVCILPNCQGDDDQLFQSCFGFVVEQLLQHNDKADKVIIYCTSTNDCATIYEFFENALGSNIYDNANQLLVNMYVKVMDDRTKKDIIAKFTKPDGPLRVVVCSSAFGLGVDCPNVRTVVHFKSPDTLMQFVQESGRVGRDGEASKSLLFVGGREFGHYKAKLTKSSAMKMQFDELETMKGYAMNTSTCRRFLILHYFDGSDEAEKQCKLMEPQNCCDVCFRSAGGFVSTSEKELRCLSIGKTANKEVVIYPQLSGKQKSEVRQHLTKYRDGLVACKETSLFGVDKVTGFTETVIEQVISKCDTFYSIKDVHDNVDLWGEDHAIAIFNIVESVKNVNTNPV
ncbi:ATP-dependent DNA helicase Q-like SIM [Paramuricea clavata]|uniref:ATP-dependent DNA helicase n=2 Tax=Paramuricea clavata TaxID=317549 RepID=A0A6S7K7L1_PARCT|nr:ATP-dependent DNA helicase Q-like SIM [Paramuricea clavata]